MEDPTRKSFSKIELKIIKNTFSNNSNDLRFKDDTRKSLQTFTSKNSFSILPKAIDLSDISRISSVPGHPRLFSLQDIDLSTISFQVSNKSLENLQELIKVSLPGSTITLPPKRLKFDSLLITAPILIKGMPGTIIEVGAGSIKIDFLGQLFECEMQKAIICEVAMEFKVDQNHHSEIITGALFTLESGSGNLEVRDCDIRSLNENSFEDFAFWVNGSAYKKKSGKFNSTVNICSCNIQGFFEVCRAGPNASVLADKCFITGCKGNAFTVMNPKELGIKNSVIEKTEKNAIDVFLWEENLGTGSVSGSKADTRGSVFIDKNVVVEGNDIKGTGNYGINLWSESTCHFEFDCVIKSNKILNCKKEGIAVRHLNINTLLIDSNDSNCNQGTGYWLQKVVTSNLSICNNRAYDNYSGYGLYIYDTGGITKNNEFFRNSLGGIMVVGASKGTNTNLLIKKSQIVNNGENGITVMDVYKGVIEISQCKVNENLHDGINLLQTREIVEGNTKENSAVSKILGCEVVGNSLFGLNVVRFKCWIEKLKISDNVQGNIMVAEDTKGLVKFLGEVKSDEGKNVKKKGMCGKHKCLVF